MPLFSVCTYLSKRVPLSLSCCISHSISCRRRFWSWSSRSLRTPSQCSFISFLSDALIGGGKYQILLGSEEHPPKKTTASNATNKSFAANSPFLIFCYFQFRPKLIERNIIGFFSDEQGENTVKFVKTSVWQFAFRWVKYSKS